VSACAEEKSLFNPSTVRLLKAWVPHPLCLSKGCGFRFNFNRGPTDAHKRQPTRITVLN